MNALAWDETPEALALLAKIDACERSSDRYAELGWNGPSRYFSEEAAECENELDELRRDAVDAFADAAFTDRDTDAWNEAWCEADDEAETVANAVARARRLHMGDSLFEQADAA